MKNKNFLVLVRHGQSEWNAKKLIHWMERS